jgi:hypothetical protein
MHGGSKRIKRRRENSKTPFSFYRFILLSPPLPFFDSAVLVVFSRWGSFKPSVSTGHFTACTWGLINYTQDTYSTRYDVFEIPQLLVFSTRIYPNLISLFLSL